MNKFGLIILSIMLSYSTKAQKITLQFTSSPTSTPSVSAAKLRFDKAFAYSFTLDDAAEDAYTVALPLFKGGRVNIINEQTSGLFFTDGCGNDVPFRAGIAWNSANQYGQDVHTGTVGGMLTWTQLDSLYNAGWDVFNHSYWHRAEFNGSRTMTDAEYNYQITQNAAIVRQKTQKAIEMPLFVVPSGDFYYQDRALAVGSKAVFDQNFPNYDVSFTGVDVGNVPSLPNNKMCRWELRAVLTGEVANKVAPIAAETQNGTVYKWQAEFEHRIDGLDNTAPVNYFKFRNYMQDLAQNYGKNGTDKMWFAPLQTVYEYLQMRQYAQFSTQIVAGNRMEIDFNLANVPTWLRRKTLTLVVNSDVNFSQVVVPAGVEISFKGSGNRKIINLDFTNFSGAIPVELTDFTGKQAQNGSVQLNWRTASEVNLKQFDVEKSGDGKNFKAIGSVKAKGFTGIQNYVFEDINFKNPAYYRLRSVNNDGTFDYSKIITIAASGVHPTIKVVPSVSDDIWTVESDSDDLRRGQIDVFDANGRLMLSQKGTDKLIKTNQLPRGLYFVKVTIGQLTFTKKMVKI